MSDASSEKTGCLALLLRMFGIGGGTSGPGSPPFRMRDDFLSAAEVSFYHVLRQAVGMRMVVCPKVGLGDVFFVSRPNENQGARNRIVAKHVDFLLCNPATMRPLAGIELDDVSHAREDRRERDALVEKVFEAAGLTLVRFPVQRAYSLAEVERRITAALGDGAMAVPAPEGNAPQESGAALTAEPATTMGSAPLCPKCGIPLVIRSGAKGKFYGCSNFPKCRATVALG